MDIKPGDIEDYQRDDCKDINYAQVVINFMTQHYLTREEVREILKKAELYAAVRTIKK